MNEAPARFRLSRRAFAAGAALLPIGCARHDGTASRFLTGPTTPDVSNPLVRQRADAQVFRHADGQYYMMASVPEYDRLIIRRAATLAGLGDPASEAVVWRRPVNGKMAGYIWAPELHWFEGAWHIYFAAGDGGEPFRIRTYVLICRASDPLSGTWDLLGQLETPWDSFTLDSTIFVHHGVRYACWAPHEPGIDTNSNLYLAPLAAPTRLARAPARLTVPTLDWEIPGYKVNEAPALLARNGRLFLTYSAAATDARYCLGMLTADEDADVMNPRAWTKSREPVFKTSRDTSVFGPGHNSFTVDEQGRDILVYHGRDYEEIDGDPLFDPNRHTRVQRIYYDAQGRPDFGVPVGNGPLPERFEMAERSGIWLSHDGTRPFAGKAPLPQTQFRSLPAGDGGVRLSPILLPQQYLSATADGSVRIAAGSAAGGQPAADVFDRVAARDGKTVQFRSRAFSGKALAAADGALRLASAADPRAAWAVS